ncbi:MAG: hypothetical protein IH598_13060 [Bacteroidales bacterium]|nr:hypothetical protein [Bacteroidales bacterium]
MKKIFTIICILALGLNLQAQDVNEKLSEAQSEYKSGNLENARFALQEALQFINQAIGREVLEMLPTQLGDMTKLDTDDNVTGTTALFAGLFINRRYASEKSNASIEIMSDSPLITSINAFMSLPAIMVTDPNQKRIKVDNYRGMLTKSKDTEGVVSYNAQIPIGSTLFTFNTTGIADEKTVTDYLNQLQIGKIAKFAE